VCFDKEARGVAQQLVQQVSLRTSMIGLRFPLNAARNVCALPNLEAHDLADEPALRLALRGGFLPRLQFS
jgi:hypothetical protein